MDAYCTLTHFPQHIENNEYLKSPHPFLKVATGNSELIVKYIVYYLSFSLSSAGT